jgi:hypothetical protein
MRIQKLLLISAITLLISSTTANGQATITKVVELNPIPETTLDNPCSSESEQLSLTGFEFVRILLVLEPNGGAHFESRFFDKLVATSGSETYTGKSRVIVITNQGGASVTIVANDTNLVSASGNRIIIRTLQRQTINANDDVVVEFMDRLVVCQ